MRLAIERALHPLDLARQEMLRTFVQIPALQPLRRREPRVLAFLSVHALIAFALTLFWPSLPIVLTPLLLGVPHVAADFRYLLLRPTLPRSWLFATILFSLGMLVLRAFHPSAAPTPTGLRAEHALGGVWLLVSVVMGTLSVSGSLRPRHALALLAALALATAALLRPFAFSLVLLHGHNLLALAIWLALFRRELRSAGMLALTLLLMAAWLASGAGLPFTLAHGALSGLGLHLFLAADWLAPGVPDRWAIGLTMSFAFLQTIHYAIWLFAIPQQALAREASLSWRMSYHALLGDFGRNGLLAVGALGLVVIVAGVFAPLLTRTVYLSLAGFHAWFELASLLYFVSAGMTLRGSTAP